MKFCLSSLQNQSYLEKADEIKVDFANKTEIPDLAEKYPEATIVLYHYYLNNAINWEEIEKYKILSREKFIFCGSTYAECAEAKRRGIKFFYGFPILTFSELRIWAELGPEYVRVGGPLFFKLPAVKRFDIPIRMIPNVSYVDGLPHKDGVCGQWIRPEDLAAEYAEYVDAVEFEESNINREQALFRIYAEQKEWPGEIGRLITGFNYLGENRMVPPHELARRINCGQRCAEDDGCHLCYRIIDLANPDLYKNLSNPS